MMRNRFARIVALISCMALLSPCAAETAEPYAEDEFPSFMKDLRRAEIITLGAMPFVTLNVSLCYSLGKFAAHDFDTAYFANPFAQTDSSVYTTGEQAGIILTSLGISLGIGLTDFIVHAIKRSSAKKKLQAQQNQSIKITPVTEDEDAVRIPPPGGGPSSNQQEPDSEESDEGMPKTGRPLEVISGNGGRQDER